MATDRAEGTPRSLTSPDFWVDVGERCVRSFAHGALLGLGVGLVPGQSVPLLAALLFGLLMAFVSLLTSLSSITIPGSDPNTGSYLPMNAGVALVSRLRGTR
jgi:hypothetical protein